MLRNTITWIITFTAFVFFFDTGLMAQFNNDSCRLLVLEPAHFHAALLQKTAYPRVSSTVRVYAPAADGALDAYLRMIESYNHRADSPTAWREMLYTGPDFLEKMLRDRKGNVVVLAGNNRQKTDYILRSVEAGLNVFADKPMAIDVNGFEKLKAAFALAGKNKLVLYDMMTERYQPANVLQKALAAMPELFGRMLDGSADEPAIVVESVHHFFKTVSGKPLVRPAWYFDTRQQGEGIVDVSTHLVDLVLWEYFSGRAPDYRRDIRMISAKRWPTRLTRRQFGQVTGLQQIPDYLQPDGPDSLVSVYANGEMLYTIRGVHVKVTVRWNFAAPAGGGDSYVSRARGSKADLVIREGADQHFVPELYIEPKEQSADYERQVREAFRKLEKIYPGIMLQPFSGGWQVMIPDQYRIDHEASFSRLTQKFLSYLQKGKIPGWERAAMLAKYYTTTAALQMALKAGK